MGYLAADGGVCALDGAHDAEEVIGAGPASGGRGALVRGVGDGRRGEAIGEVVHFGWRAGGRGLGRDVGARRTAGFGRGCVVAVTGGDSCRVGAPLRFRRWNCAEGAEPRPRGGGGLDATRGAGGRGAAA